MGRYTSVQSYADNNSNVRSVSYEQATGSGQAKAGPVKTEKVSNPYGSTAGAGSGEFHVYRHARAREMARWKEMDAVEEEEEKEKAFQESLQKSHEETESKAAKNRRKRQRLKEAKSRKKNLIAAGIIKKGEMNNSDGTKANEEEFTYTPLAFQKKEENNKDEDSEPSAAVKAVDIDVDVVSPEEIPTDGSFLEVMKKKLASKESGADNAPDKPKPSTPADAHQGNDSDSDDDGCQPPPAKKQAVTA